jgi:hypothetical protein
VLAVLVPGFRCTVSSPTLTRVVAAKLSDASASEAPGTNKPVTPRREAAMRCSINIPNLGDFADPRKSGRRGARRGGRLGQVVRLGPADRLQQGSVGEFAATNILLTAAALATIRIRLAPQVTPVSRRRPRQLAREIATLDRLSGGRMILGVALATRSTTSTAASASPATPRFWPVCWTRAWRPSRCCGPVNRSPSTASTSPSKT